MTRIAQVAITGFVWSGPSTHTWYAVLERIVTIQDPILGLIARIILDALIYSPLTVSGYFVVRAILEGDGWRSIQEKLQTKFFGTVLGAWKFWPAANIINFGFVPVELRVLYVNVLSLFWTGYLSYVNAQKAPAAAATKTE
jgi:protein Mpv17